MLRSSVLARGLGRMGIVALAWLPACSGQVIANTGGSGGGGDGGAGGEGTTTSGSEGGEGGGTTTASGGCSPACDEHNACVDGECAPIRVATITAWRLGYHGLPDLFGELGSVGACERLSTPPPAFSVLAEEGDCTAVIPTPWPDEEPGGLSGVVAKAPSFGALTLKPSMACLSADVPITPAYLDGETVTFNVAAGVHNPAFTMEATSPPPFTLTTGALHQAQPQPLEIAWESTGTPDSIFLHANDTDVAIQCYPTGGTSVVIGSSLTSLLPLGNKTWRAIGRLRGEESALDLSPTYRARASAARYAYVEVPSFQ